MGAIIILEYRTLGTNMNFIKSLTSLVLNKENNRFSKDLCPPKTQCPNQFIKCPCL